MAKDSNHEKKTFYDHLEQFRFWSQPASIEVADAQETRFLERSTGRDIDTIAQESSAYLLHLRSVTDGKWIGEMDGLFHAGYVLREEPFGKVVQICAEVADLLHEHSGISINKIAQKLQLKKVLREDPGLCKDPFAQSLIFSTLGWLSLLYIPSRHAQTNELRITIQGTKSATRGSIPAELVARPLDELLRSFGDLLPRTTSRPISNEQKYSQEPSIKFLVSHLSVATMKDIANMQIVWVDSLSAHLEFDPTIPSVSVFKCPSFTKIQQSEDSTLAIMLRQMYEEDEKPSEDFCVANLLGEVMLSYMLLFRNDRRSRKVYQSFERLKASLGKSANRLKVDPCLDELCGNNVSASFFTFGSAVRDSYDFDTDFPILGERLKQIQDYMSGIQPNRFMSLWRDRRDLRLWYTIWTVIILGVVSLVVTTVSMFIAVEQVVLARKAYELQLQQGPQCSTLCLKQDYTSTID